jgi:hypothetical protein
MMRALQTVHTRNILFDVMSYLTDLKSPVSRGITRFPEADMRTDKVVVDEEPVVGKEGADAQVPAEEMQEACEDEKPRYPKRARNPTIEWYRVQSPRVQKKRKQIGDHALHQRGFGLGTLEGAERGWATPGNTGRGRQRERAQATVHQTSSKDTFTSRH